MGGNQLIVDGYSVAVDKVNQNQYPRGSSMLRPGRGV